MSFFQESRVGIWNELIFLPKMITVIGWIITGISWGIVLVTMPFSLCVCFKVSYSPHSLQYLATEYGLEYVQNIFSRSLKKTSHQRKLRQTKCLLFNFWMIKLTKTTILPNCEVPNGFFWYNCKFYHSKFDK